MNLDISKLMEQAKKVQEEMSQSTENFQKITAEGESGAGMVKALVNGNLEVLNIEIEEQIILPNEKEMMENLIVAAINNAISAARKKTEKELGQKAGTIMKQFNFDDLNKAGDS